MYVKKKTSNKSKTKKVIIEPKKDCGDNCNCGDTCNCKNKKTKTSNLIKVSWARLLTFI